MNGPAGALTTKDGQAIVFISKYNSTSSKGEMNHAVNSIENPMPTIACQNRISLVSAFMQQYHGNGVPVSIDGLKPLLQIAFVMGLVLVSNQIIMVFKTDQIKLLIYYF